MKVLAFLFVVIALCAVVFAFPEKDDANQTPAQDRKFKSLKKGFGFRPPPPVYSPGYQQQSIIVSQPIYIPYSPPAYYPSYPSYHSPPYAPHY